MARQARGKSSRSFRGAPEGREPGTQKQRPSPPLDSGSGANAPSRKHGPTRPDLIRVARIGAPHGVRGEVKLWTFTEDPLAVADYAPLESQDGKRQFEIDSLRPAGDHLVARFAGVADRNAAELLRNIDLYVARERLPDIDAEDTWYYADLIGLSAVSPDGEALGTVLALHNFGAGDVIEIQPATGGKTLLLPFTMAVVPEVDIEGGRVVVVVPAEIEVREPDPTEGKPED